MNIELIKNFVLRNINLFDTIEFGYLIPKNIKSKVGGKLINIKSNRQEALRNNNSKYSKRFEEDIKLFNNYTSLQYIKEFPIVIDDRDLWNNIMTNLCVDGNSELRKITYFLLDFYFINFNLAVEIDSKYHDGKEIYDTARDVYLKSKYGIETLRFYEYGNSTDSRYQFINTFRNYLDTFIMYNKNWGLVNRKVIFDDIIVNLFIQSNYKALEFINKIIDYVGFTKFYRVYNIKLDLKDLVKLDNTLSIKELKKKGSLDQLFIDGVTLLMLQIYNRKLTVT